MPLGWELGMHESVTSHYCRNNNKENREFKK